MSGPLKSWAAVCPTGRANGRVYALSLTLGSAAGAAALGLGLGLGLGRQPLCPHATTTTTSATTGGGSWTWVLMPNSLQPPWATLETALWR
jgi:hypothetical protein